jgi:tRNA-dihydrouridine synthase B
MLYLAPMQGLTDCFFRRVFSKHFGGIDAYFIPYITLKNGEVKKSQLKEILPENNNQQRVVPQVLFKDSAELKELAKIIRNSGYNEVNLNLGCPYPMVTNQGEGAGLLPYPEKLKEIFDECFKEAGLTFSAKLRAGLKQKEEIFPIIEVLNKYNFSEIIYHPRVARQLYKGPIIDETIASVLESSAHPVVLNGDIFSTDIYRERKLVFPKVETWMLGRGILMNPFLAEEIKGIVSPGQEKKQRLRQFHDELFVCYSERLSGSGHILAKMAQFWEYFSFSFAERQKVFKKIRKATKIENYKMAVREIFGSSF